MNNVESNSYDEKFHMDQFNNMVQTAKRVIPYMMFRKGIYPGNKHESDFESKGWEIFMDILNYYDPNEEEINGKKKFVSYLCKSLSRAYGRMYEKIHNRREILFSELPIIPEIKVENDDINDIEIKEIISLLLGSINDNKRRVLELRFMGCEGLRGLGKDGRNLSYEQAGNLMGITKETARQREIKILSDLRESPLLGDSLSLDSLV